MFVTLVLPGNLLTLIMLMLLATARGAITVRQQQEKIMATSKPTWIVILATQPLPGSRTISGTALQTIRGSTIGIYPVLIAIPIMHKP